MWWLAAVALTVSSVAAQALPPVLPTAFFGQFTEYTAPQTVPPPFVDGIPQAPFYGSRGLVFYDWSRRAMIEVRLDQCVNIFPAGANFSCTFFNINATSYLISSAASGFPPCCVFEKPFHPPSPDFLRTSVTAASAGSVPWNDFEASWWVVPDILPPTGPFYYAFESNKSPQIYLAFSFPGVSGWVQQNFFNMTAAAPDPDVFQLPSICASDALPSCGFRRHHAS